MPGISKGDLLPLKEVGKIKGLHEFLVSIMQLCVQSNVAVLFTKDAVFEVKIPIDMSGMETGTAEIKRLIGYARHGLYHVMPEFFAESGNLKNTLKNYFGPDHEFFKNFYRKYDMIKCDEKSSNNCIDDIQKIKMCQKCDETSSNSCIGDNTKKICKLQYSDSNPAVTLHRRLG
jgi:hypothetical protein